NIAEAHVVTGRRHDLAVVEGVAPAREVPIEYCEADLRGVRLARKLRLGHEHATERDAVAAAGQIAALIPHFEAVYEAGVEEFRKGAHDARRNPGQVPAARAFGSASGDHALEVAVESDAVVRLPHLPLEPPGDVQFVEEQQRAFRWR